MDFAGYLSFAFSSQLTMLLLPLSIYVLLKFIGYLADRFITQEVLDRWFKKPPPKQEEKEERPSLNKGPFLDKETNEDPYVKGAGTRFLIRKGDKRGRLTNGWIDAFYSFNFGNYKDKFVGHGNLRVLNEEFIVGGKSFPQLLKKDFELVYFVIDGSLNHYDDLENSYSLDTNNLQLMTCGTGIKHLEENAIYDQKLHIVTLWFAPYVDGLSPNYKKLDFNGLVKRNQLVCLVSPYKGVEKIKVQQEDKQNTNENENQTFKAPTIKDIDFISKTTKLPNTLGIYSDTFIYYCLLESNATAHFTPQPKPKRKAYLHVMMKEQFLNDNQEEVLLVNEEHRLGLGDGAFLAGLNGDYSLTFKNTSNSNISFIVVEMA